MLPTFSPLAEEYAPVFEKEVQPTVAGSTSARSTRAASTFSISKGVTYANNWAERKNTSKYHYFNNGDCANFASQILEAGGVKQVSSASVGSGWWHTWSLFGGHKHSQSWSMAKTFANYQGKYFKTTKGNFRAFSKKVKKGDFVAFDRTGDGSVNHVGFVTAKGSGEKTYTNGTYVDFKIAQHTDNYNKWCSSNG